MPPLSSLENPLSSKHFPVLLKEKARAQGSRGQSLRINGLCLGFGFVFDHSLWVQLEASEQSVRREGRSRMGALKGRLSPGTKALVKRHLQETVTERESPGTIQQDNVGPATKLTLERQEGLLGMLCVPSAPQTPTQSLQQLGGTGPDGWQQEDAPRLLRPPLLHRKTVDGGGRFSGSFGSRIPQFYREGGADWARDPGRRKGIGKS